MHNLQRRLTVGLLVCVLAPVIARSQEVKSSILSSPWSNRLGSQLIFFYEDGETPGRGSWQSYLTVVNMNVLTKVALRFQFFTTNCKEVSSFVDILGPFEQRTIDPKAIPTPDPANPKISVTNDRYLLVVTPVNYEGPTSVNTQAIPFNWMGGWMETRQLKNGTGWLMSPISRKVVDTSGTPADPAYTSLAFTTQSVDGNARVFQSYQPTLLLVNSFFRTSGTDKVMPGVPFGNRMTVVVLRDIYDGGKSYNIQGGDATLTSFVFDNAENAFSVPARTTSCVREWVLAPDTVDAIGNFSDFLGPALTSAVNTTGGWLRMRVSTLAANTSIFGWFTQALAPFGGGDLLVGVGRQPTVAAP